MPELLAPKEVIFTDSKARFLGVDESLPPLIVFSVSLGWLIFLAP
jgi:hypothetical protein